jgi:FKBP-type peptidyl-prolyl cis-trans isomerase (trigger factor)
MQVEKSQVEDGVLKVKYIFSIEEHLAAENKVLKKMATKSSVSGFRKGKVPLALIKSQTESGQLIIDIMLELADQALRDKESQDIDYIGRSEVIDFNANPKDNGFYVQMSFVLKPKVTLPDYKKKAQDKKWAIGKDDSDQIISEKISSFFDQISQDSIVKIPQKLIDDTLKQHQEHDSSENHSHDIKDIEEQIRRDLIFATLAEELEVKVDDNQLMSLFYGYQPNKKKNKSLDRRNYENFRASIIWQMFSGKVRDLLLVNKSIKKS